MATLAIVEFLCAVPKNGGGLDQFSLTDIAQMTSRFAEIIPPYRRRGNCIPFAAIHINAIAREASRSN